MGCGVRTLERLLAQSNNPAPISIPVTFTDIRKTTGIVFRHDAAGSEEKYYLETMGSGVGWIDYNQDGLLDLYFVQQGSTKAYKPPRPLHPALYRNNGDGTFTDVTEASGIAVEDFFGTAVAVGDYDNNGYPDLYLTGYGGALLFRNNGDGTFTDVTDRAGVRDRGQWPSSAGWFDYDKDGHLDLLVCNYLYWSPDNNPWCGDPPPGPRGYCHPKLFKGQKVKLFHNRGDGTFSDVSEESGVGIPESKSLGVVLADLNNDGWPDIFVANDSWPNFLFLNSHDGTFSDVSYTSGLAVSEDGQIEAGMGTDAADIDGDGWLDIFVTHLALQLHRLYRNNHDGTFDDYTQPSGIGRKAYLMSGVSSKIFDYDNDGWNDILQANGSMLDNVELFHADQAYKEPKLMFRNLGGGKFEKVSEYLGADFMRRTAARGAAVGDFDNDGDLDVAVSNRGDYPQLLRNDGGNAHNWLLVKLVGTKSARDGTGAILKLESEGRTQVEQAKGGMSYMSAHDLRVHFGLGQRKTIQSLEIRWLSGTVDKLVDLPINQVITLKEGTGIVPSQFPVVRGK